MRTCRVVLASLAVFLLVSVTGMIGCSSSDDNSGGGVPGAVLLNENVAVAGGGGSATVFFQGEAGRTIRITLSGPSATAPYGFLEPPGGEATYTPPNNGRAGTNEADVNLTVTGQFSLTIFDGNNAGGTIRVQVRVLT